MLDIKLLRADPQAVAGRLKVKGFELDVALFEQLEGERRRLQEQTEQLQNERNVKSRALDKRKRKAKT